MAVSAGLICGGSEILLSEMELKLASTFAS